MERREITLPSGLRATIKKPGPLARVAAMGRLPTKEILDLGEAEGGEPRRKGAPVPAADLAMMEVKFVLACLVTPKLSADDPAPAGFEFIDDVLDLDDWQALRDAVAEFAKPSHAEAVRPLSATGKR